MAFKDDIQLTQCVSIDFETCLIRPGLTAPPVVCMTLAASVEHGWLRDALAAYWDSVHTEIQDRETGGVQVAFVPTEFVRPLFATVLAEQRALVLGHNFAYDASCALEWLDTRALQFDVYDSDRVLDTMLCQRLIEIETGDMRGKLALDLLCARYGLHHDSKGEIDPDTGEPVRLSYGRYLGAPLSAYPPEFIRYACDDAALTLRLFGRMLQRGLVARRDLAKMCRSDLALKGVSAEGLLCDGARVQQLEETTRTRRAAVQRELARDHGDGLPPLLRPKSKRAPDGEVSKTMSAVRLRVAEAFELPYRIEQKSPKHQPQVLYAGDPDTVRGLQDRGLLTDKGNIATGRLVLEESGDPILEMLAEYGEWSAIWNKDLPAFQFSASTGLPLHTRFGFAATTRTTSGGGIGGIRFNQQNQRKVLGLRECFVAPEGGAYVASDFSVLEGATLAQVVKWTLGRTGLVERYNANLDDHVEVGRHMMRGINQMSYDEMAALVAAGDTQAGMCRNAGKPLNYGLPGYMTRPATVASYARIGYGVDRPVEFWAQMIDLWYATQHDKVAYLREYVDGLRNPGGSYDVPIPGTTILRRGASRTAAGNTPFQGLGAQVATEALYWAFRAQMLGQMPGRLCGFVHDELISHTRGSQHADDIEHLRAQQERCMVDAAARVMPDIQMRVESVAMRHWSKEAKHVVDKSTGRIVLQCPAYLVETKKEQAARKAASKKKPAANAPAAPVVQKDVAPISAAPDPIGQLLARTQQRMPLLA